MLQVVFQQLATAGSVLEVSGCVLMGTESPIGFSVTPAGKKTAHHFQVESEDQQTEWMSGKLPPSTHNPTQPNPTQLNPTKPN